MKKLLTSKKQALLILIDKTGKSSKYMTDYLNESLNKESIKTTLAKFSDLVFETDGENIKVFVKDINIKDFDLVYIRRADHSLFSLAGTLALCLDHFEIKYFDTRFRDIGAAGDKFTSQVTLLLAGLPTIPTFFCWRDEVPQLKQRIISKFGYPIVAKEFATQHGKGVYVIRDEKDFDNLLLRKREDRKENFLFQKFIPIEREYRLLVMGDKVTVAQKMHRDTSKFALSIDWEAEEVFTNVGEIPQAAQDIAVKAAKSLNIEIAGVDIAFEKETGKIWLLEVNRGPGFTFDVNKSPEIPELAKFFKEELKK